MRNRRNRKYKIVLIVCVLCIIVSGCFQYNNFLLKERELQNEPIKISCVGDSLTFRRAYEGEKIYNYSYYLQEILGEEYEVKNYGEAGACVRTDGNYPYEALRVYDESLKSNADILIIMIGTNDVWEHNWQGNDLFRKEYIELIDSYSHIENEAKIYLCTIPEIYKQDGTYVETAEGERVDIVSDIICEVAKERNYQVIDMNYVTGQHFEWYSEDCLHFSNDGAREVAKFLAEIINNDCELQGD